MVERFGTMRASIAQVDILWARLVVGGHLFATTDADAWIHNLMPAFLNANRPNRRELPKFDDVSEIDR